MSSSSFYHSLDNLENRGLIKYNFGESNKVETIEGTEYTEILINTILKHFIKFGLVEREQNRTLPDIVRNSCKEIFKEKCNKMLYVNFTNFIFPDYIKALSSLTNELFILSNPEVYENFSNQELKQFQRTSLYEDTIREAENFYDIVIIPYINEFDNIQGTNRSKLLKEAIRVVNNNGIVIINGFLHIPKQDLGILNIFRDWIKNNYGELNLFSKEKFRKELDMAGAVNIEFTVNNGILFGYGSKP